jgi:hypothetical protein
VTLVIKCEVSDWEVSDREVSAGEVAPPHSSFRCDQIYNKQNYESGHAMLKRDLDVQQTGHWTSKSDLSLHKVWLQ